MHASEAHDQLEQYIVTLSTRLFWLQKAIGSDLKQEIPRTALRELVEGVPQKGLPTNPVVLPEAARPSSWAWWLLSILAGTGGGAWTGLRWHRQRRQWLKSSIWVLPEPETPPRLGGAFCGGGGAMIKFG